MDDLHRRLVQAIADPGHFTRRGDDYAESIPSWGARAVVIALDLSIVCSCCGLAESDCKGLDYWGEGHEYEPLAISRNPLVGAAASASPSTDERILDMDEDARRQDDGWAPTSARPSSPDEMCSCGHANKHHSPDCYADNGDCRCRQFRRHNATLTSARGDR